MEFLLCDRDRCCHDHPDRTSGKDSLRPIKRSFELTANLPVNTDRRWIKRSPGCHKIHDVFDVCTVPLLHGMSRLRDPDGQQSSYWILHVSWESDIGSGGTLKRIRSAQTQQPVVRNVAQDSEAPAIDGDALQCTLPTDGRQIYRHVRENFRTGKDDCCSIEPGY